jgi:EmrB/QacA subfamily drug resistance transporter
MASPAPLSERPIGPAARHRLLIELPRPAAVRDSPRAPWLAVFAVCIGAFMGQLDASIVNLAYQPVERAFHVSLGAASWVGLAYLLTLVALVTPAGRVSDLLGRKLLYVYGFGVFVVGSALCALAPDLGLLLGFRVLQAIGAAMMQANSVAIVVMAMPRERLGRAIGVQGAAQALGLALGPTLGGLLVAAGGWRLLFAVNVPIGIAGIVLAIRLVPRTRTWPERGQFDTAGAVLLPLGAGATLGALSLGSDLGWSSPAVLLLGAGAVAAVTLFVRREHAAPSPLVEPALFRRRAVSTGIVTALLSYAFLFGIMFLVPFEMITALHIGAPEAGLELTAMPVALGITAPLAGRLADRIGPRPLTVAGMATGLAAIALLALSDQSTGLRLAALALVGAGMGMFLPANSASIMGGVRGDEAGTASGLLNLTRGLGTALGLALAAAAEQATGYRGALAVLGAVAAVAAAVSGLRPPAPSRSPSAG